MKNCCQNHSGRVAAVEEGGAPKCWECYLGKEKFTKKFGKDFYEVKDDKGKDISVK